mmetsp:Transcript_6371/g.15858  ORF Transcript_6371/g.15858 Transcript_6371/m.15858 type:complete len:307 (-) Transcript_6371:796-1716(-)
MKLHANVNANQIVKCKCNRLYNHFSIGVRSTGRIVFECACCHPAFEAPLHIILVLYITSRPIYPQTCVLNVLCDDVILGNFQSVCVTRKKDAIFVDIRVVPLKIHANPNHQRVQTNPNLQWVAPTAGPPPDGFSWLVRMQNMRRGRIIRTKIRRARLGIHSPERRTILDPHRSDAVGKSNGPHPIPRHPSGDPSHRPAASSHPRYVGQVQIIPERAIGIAYFQNPVEQGRRRGLPHHPAFLRGPRRVVPFQFPLVRSLRRREGPVLDGYEMSAELSHERRAMFGQQSPQLVSSRRRRGGMTMMMSR